jgi:hypothetical protein
MINPSLWIQFGSLMSCVLLYYPPWRNCFVKSRILYHSGSQLILSNVWSRYVYFSFSHLNWYVLCSVEARWAALCSDANTGETVPSGAWVASIQECCRPCALTDPCEWLDDTSNQLTPTTSILRNFQHPSCFIVLLLLLSSLVHTTLLCLCYQGSVSTWCPNNLTHSHKANYNNISN